jgi:hypothetical protein
MPSHKNDKSYLPILFVPPRSNGGIIKPARRNATHISPTQALFEQFESLKIKGKSAHISFAPDVKGYEGQKPKPDPEGRNGMKCD